MLWSVTERASEGTQVVCHRFSVSHPVGGRRVTRFFTGSELVPVLGLSHSANVPRYTKSRYLHTLVVVCGSQGVFRMIPAEFFRSKQIKIWPSERKDLYRLGMQRKKFPHFTVTQFSLSYILTGSQSQQGESFWSWEGVSCLPCLGELGSVALLRLSWILSPKEELPRI